MVHGQNVPIAGYVRLTDNRNYRPWYQRGTRLFK